ncbi:MAG TPA: glycogen synthase GlgA [Methylothermaceae bacterium]|nr:glycogen synthase GlgA [Methylothermaceae bacterium]
MKILFVASELYPLIKTGGLADVAGSLPKALRELDKDVRVLLPGYLDVKDRLPETRVAAELEVLNQPVRLLGCRIPGSEIPLWLLDAPQWFDRPGNPYLAPDGNPWPDNDERFAALCWAGVKIALDQAGLDWQPDVVHGNDWQTGLIPALLSLESPRPATVFTIHNLAYQGIFPASSVEKLQIPRTLWHPEGLEFHHQLSFIKGGIVYADRVNTVSPTYAREIQTPRFGCGLEGVLKTRGDRLSGILNGIDTDKWNPATDPLLPQTYGPDSLEGKGVNKRALQAHFGLPQEDIVPLIAFIGRLVSQKGVDLILKALSGLLELPLQFVFLGSGDSDYEHGLLYWSRRHPDKVAVHVGYDEALSHRIEAGADMFLMPSRFEPCGLNQMYSQRYGTVPIVHRTGGLADTVEDALPDRLAQATGISFDHTETGALQEVIKRGWLLYSHPDIWRSLQRNGMRKDFSWRRSAMDYCQLYLKAIADKKQA